MNRPPAAAHDFWVVIPAYNEGATVRDVAARARRYCANVIVVDDGSTDGTLEALAGLDITLLRNEQNRGKADSLGADFSRHWPRARPESLRSMRTASTRRKRSRPSLRRRCMIPMPSSSAPAVHTSENAPDGGTSRIALPIFGFPGRPAEPIEDSQSGFRLYPTRFLRQLTLKHGLKQSFVFESEVLIEASRQGVQLPAHSHKCCPADRPSPQPFSAGAGHCQNH